MPQFAPHLSVLVVEDNRDISRLMVDYLEDRGHQPDSALDGLGGLHLAATQRYDAIVLDLALPGIDGLELCRRLRQDAASTVPILMLTARDTLEDKLRGFEAGADDYLVKPFEMAELVARLRALIRRTAGWADSIIACPPLKLDTREKRAFLDDAELELTAYEYQLLEYLTLHAGEVVSKTELTEHLYPDDADRDSNVIEVFIRRLRLKLDPNECLRPIETLRGRGYRLALRRA
ncbi:MAG TPA: DNA-binding response regulator [Gammaproteobacteria bacterium]|nr:DNA-binding response regulator [Gammaproteobacteria bacterium]